MKKIFLILVLALTFISLASVELHAQSRRSFGSAGVVPMPRLISPTSEVVNRKDKDGILFKWSSQQMPTGGRRKFRFQLYEGYDMYEQGLIFKKEIDPHVFEIFIERDKFEDGKAYTWSLRQRGSSPSWSRRSFYTFRLKK